MKGLIIRNLKGQHLGADGRWRTGGTPHVFPDYAAWEAVKQAGCLVDKPTTIEPAEFNPLLRTVKTTGAPSPIAQGMFV